MATERRRTNQRVTTVFAGTRPHKAKATPKKAFAANICHSVLDLAEQREADAGEDAAERRSASARRSG